MPDTIDLRSAPAGSPEWWLARLLARLEARRLDLETFEAYYDGHQPLAFASQKFRDAFGSRFREFSSNFMSLVVDAPGEQRRVVAERVAGGPLPGLLAVAVGLNARVGERLRRVFEELALHEEVDARDGEAGIEQLHHRVGRGAVGVEQPGLAGVAPARP